ncbi:MAG: hypothetical protein WDM79_15770 [Terricaulis sp.]
MPDVFLDPRLPDYFEDIDLSTPAGASAVLPAFLSSKIGVLRGVDLAALDFDLLRSISFPQLWEMKKFQFSRFALDFKARGEAAQYYALVLEACGRDMSRFNALLKQFTRLTRILDDLHARIFDGVVVERVDLLCRFSETRQENLHYDQDVGCDDHEGFRLYINIDSAPRIWGVSYQLNDLAERLAGRIKAEKLADLPSEQLVKTITSRVFGGWHNRADERAAPRHMVYFDPGDIWVVDGRSVAHQVLYGQRVITTYARIPLAANPTLSPSFHEKARAALTAASGPPNRADASITLRGPSILPPTSKHHGEASLAKPVRAGCAGSMNAAW